MRRFARFLAAFVLAAALVASIAGCAALGHAFTPTTNPDGTPGKTPAEMHVAPAVDEAAPFLGPWGLVATALFGSGGAVFTIGKTIARVMAAKKSKDATPAA